MGGAEQVAGWLWPEARLPAAARAQAPVGTRLEGAHGSQQTDGRTAAEQSPAPPAFPAAAAPGPWGGRSSWLGSVRDPGRTLFPITSEKKASGLWVCAPLWLGL